VKSWDAIVVGAGIVGLSLAIELNKQGLRVLVVEKGEPGREASWAAGGMLADFPLETPLGLRELATASARMYPEFVRELEDESGLKIDLRSVGTLVLFRGGTGPDPAATQGYALPRPLAELEPALRLPETTQPQFTALYTRERCVDPRHLTSAAIAAARHRGIDFSSGDPVLAVEVANGKASGVRTRKAQFAAGLVVNCAGAWAGQIGVGTGASRARPERSRRVQAERSSAGSFVVPTRPVKGQMLCVVMPQKELVRHVIRMPDVYLIPRSDGRLVIGATQEEAGFDKQTVPETIQKLRQAALNLVPKLAEARILETWAGLRPGTPDGMPILGTTPTPGYFVATGHFRDGILLAPVTARLMSQIIAGQKQQIDVSNFSASRFDS
jgi:glycine oxidase